MAIAKKNKGTNVVVGVVLEGETLVLDESYLESGCTDLAN